jgi:hypothetical protein
MSEEKVQETVQENLDIKVESKPENADSGLLQEVMSKKATIKERDARIAELEAADEKRRHKELSEEGKKDELIAELNSKYEKIETEYTRLSKFEETEKLRLIDSITSDEDEQNELKGESLSTLRLIKSKIAAKSPEVPTARGSVGYQPPADITKMSAEDRKTNWGDIIKQYTNK